MTDAVKPWCFTALEDYPDAGILKGDIITATAGRPTRIVRYLPVNPGLLLNLAMDGVITEVEGFIVPIEERTPESTPSPTPLRVLS